MLAVVATLFLTWHTFFGAHSYAAMPTERSSVTKLFVILVLLSRAVHFHTANYSTKSLNPEGSVTAFFRVFFTGTVCGVKLYFGSGIAVLTTHFAGWLSLFVGWLSLPSNDLGCSAGYPVCFRKSRFLLSTRLSELVFTT